MEGASEVGYVGRLRQFSRNARLYLLHVVGMDLIHGAWEVLFNLYLLAVGFDVKFVGIRIAVLGIAGSLASIPAGKLADRIDRKWGFIIGDGGGAVCALILIMSTNANTILAFSAVSACFSALHMSLSRRSWRRTPSQVRGFTYSVSSNGWPLSQRW